MFDRSPTQRALRDPRQYVSIGALALLGACGFALMSAVDPVFALLGGIGVFFIVLLFPRAEILVAAFAASTFFERLSADYGLPMTPTKVLGILMIAVAIVPLVMRRRGGDRPVPTWQRHPWVLVFGVALVLWATSSIAWATDLTQVRVNLIKLATCVLTLIAIPLIVRRTSGLRTIGWWIASAGLGGVVLGMLLGSNLDGRATGVFSDPNEFATATVAGAAFAIALGESSSRVGVRWAGRFIACASFLAVASSASRSGVAAMLLAFLVLVITARGVERLRLTGILLVGASAAAVWFVTAAGGQAAAARFSGENTTGRTDLWRVAQYQFQDEPLHGVGLGNFPVRSIEYLRGDVHNWDLFTRYPRTVHNTPLELLSELGIVGFSLFYLVLIGCIVAIVGALRSARRRGDAALLGACRGTLAALAAVWAASLTLSGVYVELQWVLLGACVAASSIAAAEARAAVTARATEAAAVVHEEPALLVEPAA